MAGSREEQGGCRVLQGRTGSAQGPCVVEVHCPEGHRHTVDMPPADGAGGGGGARHAGSTGGCSFSDRGHKHTVAAQ